MVGKAGVCKGCGSTESYESGPLHNSGPDSDRTVIVCEECGKGRLKPQGIAEFAESTRRYLDRVFAGQGA